MILCIKQLTPILKNYLCSQAHFKTHIIFVNCDTPPYERLIRWTLTRAEDLQITLHQSSCNFICSYYENDLNEINQILNQLSIIYPNAHLNIQDIKKMMHDTSSHINLTNLLNAILIGNYKDSNNILQKLKIKNLTTPLVILHTIQHTILTLMLLKYHLLYKNYSHNFLFNKYKISKKRHLLFDIALQRLNIQQLHQVITILLQTELIFHQEQQNYIWNNFKLINWILCYKNTTENINEYLHK